MFPFSKHLQGSFPFLLPKTNTVDQLGEQLMKQVTLSPGGSGRIRFFEFTNIGRRKPNDFSGSEMIGNINDGNEIYAEEVPLDEVNLQEDETLISVFHFFKEPARWHGIPFRFVVKPVRPASPSKIVRWR